MVSGGIFRSLSSHMIRTPGPKISAIFGAPLSVRISTKNHSFLNRYELTEGPSCIFVGPIEIASKETLEALYCQARVAYYSGRPLIVDDMFDRVEVKLRWYGSDYVVKYPRCSLIRQSTYADAEEDLSQVLALASIWVLFLVVAISACVVPVFYTAGIAHQDPLDSGLSFVKLAHGLEFLATVNGILFMALASLIGLPVASASVKVLQGLWRNELVALKGACPNCGEEVFAFVRSDQLNANPHKANCHVCESSLEFRTKVEQSISRLGRKWVYGRILFRGGGTKDGCNSILITCNL